MQAYLEVQNVARLYNAPERINKYIRKAMTMDNPEYIEAKQHGRWTGDMDSKIRMYAQFEEGIVFPRGWTRNCIELLHRNGIKPCIVDNRREIDPVQLTFQGSLRDYQHKAVQEALQRDFGVISAATGSGKTVIALALIAERGQPVLILVHTKELLQQWADRIKEFLGVSPGLIGDGKFDVQPVTVALVQSACKHLDSLPDHFGHIVVDECHRVPSTIFRNVVKNFECKYMLGLSATTYRRDGLTKLIYYFMGDRVHQVDSEELRQNGAILVPEIVRKKTSFSYNYREDYQDMLSALVSDKHRNLQITMDIIHQVRARSGTALAVSDRVQHCQDLAELLERYNMRVRVLTGQSPKSERKRIVAEVQEGCVDVLVSTVQLLGEGFDCPGLSSLFLTTPMKFKGRLIQVIGRILRPADGKRPVIFDYVDQNVGVLNAQARQRGRAFAEVAR